MSYWIAKLNAHTPIAHGDPGAVATGNETPFRLTPVLYPRPTTATRVRNDQEPVGMETAEEARTRSLVEAEEAITDLARHYPLSLSLARSLADLTPEEFCAAAFLRSIIEKLNRLNGGDGDGLFSGRERYDLLLRRLNICAGKFNSSLFSLYASLLKELQIETVLDMREELPLYTALPRAVQLAIIKMLTSEAQSCITMARYWIDQDRKDAAGALPDYYDPTGRVAGSSLELAEALVPTISADALRHSSLRQILADHLLEVCGLGSVEQAVIKRLVPPHVSMLLNNGGNVAAGKSAPDNSEALNVAMKRVFPSLELLGGCVPTHIFNGALSLAQWTLCLQMNQFTEPLGWSSDVDASTLLYTSDNTRQTPPGMEHSKENGQMITGATLMKAGSSILAQYRFAPFTSLLARGAAYFGFQRWLALGGYVGGKHNVGLGQMRLDELRFFNDPGESLAEEQIQADFEQAGLAYAEYVERHAEELADALQSGSLGCPKPPVSWGVAPTKESESKE